jgi:hypothetical protein
MLKLEDIKVGMRVNPRDLSEIYDTLIILTNFNNHVGEIVYIGESDTEESGRIYDSLTEICSVYNDSEELEASWDE